MRFIIAMEMAAKHHWRFIWIEGDSTSDLLAFSKSSLISIWWRNRWQNCFSHGIQVLSSHIFREGNGCAGKLASQGHVVTDFVWWDIMPKFVGGISLGTVLGYLIFAFHNFFVHFWGFGLAPSCTINFFFSFFLSIYIIYEWAAYDWSSLEVPT